MKKIASSISVTFLLWAATSMACAQALSAPISQPLNYDPNSNIAPAPSTEIKPGAGNLLSPDQRIVISNPVNADISGTSMNPVVGSVDASPESTNARNGRTRPSPGSSEASRSIKGMSVSGFGSDHSSVNPFASRSNFPNAMQSVFQAGGSGSGINVSGVPAQEGPLQNSRQELSGVTKISSDTAASMSSNSRRGSTAYGRGSSYAGSSGQGMNAGQQQNSPLERQPSSALDREGFGDTSPFKSLDADNFLSPNIFKPFNNLAVNSSAKVGERNVSSVVSNEGNGGLTSRLNLSRSEQKLLRHEYRLEYRNYHKRYQQTKPGLHSSLRRRFEEDSNQ